MTAGVYKVTNVLNEHFYIGSSIDLDRRWYQHRYCANKTNNPRYYLYNAIRKHGIEHFHFEMLEECAPVKETLLSCEQHHIDTLHPTYNLLARADSRLGIKHSFEVLERLTAINRVNGEKYRRGKTFAEIFGEERAAEIKAKQSQNRTGKNLGVIPWNKGHTPDEETLRQLIQRGYQKGHTPWNKDTHGLMPEPWNKGVSLTDEVKAKLSAALIGREAWNKGMTMSEEYCQRMSEIAKENFDPEHQARMTEAAAEANRGQPRSEQTKQRISESNKNSDARKAFAETRRGVARSDDVKQKIGDAQRGKTRDYLKGKPRPNNKSGEYGISYRKDTDRWVVRINNKKHGSFASIDDAIRRRDEILAL